MSSSINKISACLVVAMFVSLSFAGASAITVDEDVCGDDVAYAYGGIGDPTGIPNLTASESDENPVISDKWISCEGFTRLKYSTSTGNGLKVIDFDGDDKKFIRVPDYIVYNGYTYVVDEIGDYGLTTMSIFGRNPVNVELGPNIVRLGVEAIENGDGINYTYSVKFRDIENSKLESIGKYAFHKCRFSELELPSSVTILGKSSFSCCDRLTDLKFSPAGLVEVQRDAFYKSAIKSFPFESAISIGYGAFYNCKQITDADLENCKYIEGEAFKGSGITHVKFGNTLEYIDSIAFDHIFYDTDGNLIDYNDVAKFRGNEFILMDGKFVAVR